MKKLSKFTMIILMCGISQHTYAKDYPIIDFTGNMPVQDISLLPKWARIVYEGNLKQGNNKPKYEDLETVQRAANRFEYVTDRDNYNVGDYWATPREVDKAFGGDCEDIAIWKYAMLKRMGWKPDDMAVWIVTINESNLQHAILVVQIDGKEYLLNSPAYWSDKFVPKPIEVTPGYMHETFTFMFKFNENGWSTK